MRIRRSSIFHSKFRHLVRNPIFFFFFFPPTICQIRCQMTNHRVVPRDRIFSIINELYVFYEKSSEWRERKGIPWETMDRPVAYVNSNRVDQSIDRSKGGRIGQKENADGSPVSSAALPGNYSGNLCHVHARQRWAMTNHTIMRNRAKKA